MAPYSMDLRSRVLREWDAGMRADDVAAKYSVSRAWVHRLQQCRRETGSIAPRRQTRWRTPLLAPLGTSACLATIWRAVKPLGFTLKKNGTRLRLSRLRGSDPRPDAPSRGHRCDGQLGVA